MLVTKQLLVNIDFHLILLFFIFLSMEVNGYQQLFGYSHFSKYLLLCSAEERCSYRFGTSLGWENDDRIFIFWWTFPLNKNEIYYIFQNVPLSVQFQFNQNISFICIIFQLCHLRFLASRCFIHICYYLSRCKGEYQCDFSGIKWMWTRGWHQICSWMQNTVCTQNAAFDSRATSFSSNQFK